MVHERLPRSLSLRHAAAVALLGWALAGCGGGSTVAGSGDSPAPVAGNQQPGSGASTPVADAPTTKPFEVLSTTPAGEALAFSSFAAVDRRLYVAGGFDPLNVLDITDLAEPRALGRIATQSGFPGDAAIDWIFKAASGDQYLAVAVTPGCNGFCQAFDDVIRLYDMSNPAAPVLKSVLPGVTADLLLDGRHLYVLRDAVLSRTPLEVPQDAEIANVWGSLAVYDISDAAEPVLLSSTTVYGAGRMAKSGQHLYIAFSDDMAWSRGVQVVDVSDPARPRIEKSHGSASTHGSYVDLAVAGDGLYTMTPDVGVQAPEVNVQLFDLSAAVLAPTVLDVGGKPVAIAQADGRLYVARSSQGVAVFDISTPTAPRRLPDVFADIRVKDIRLFNGFGLIVLPQVTRPGAGGGYDIVTPERFSLFATR